MRGAGLLLGHAPQQDTERAQVPRARRHHLGHMCYRVYTIVPGTAQQSSV